MTEVNNATVSVLMPLRRWRRWSGDAIRGVLAQTHRELELLLILPGTDDSESERVATEARYAAQGDTRLRLLHRPAGGIVNALNHGLLAAEGEYIARMDDDDGIAAERIATQLQFLETRDDIEFCALPVQFFSDEIEVQGGNRRYAAWLNAHADPASIAAAALSECMLPHPSWFATRAAWQRIGPYREFDGPEDYDRFLEAWLAGIGMAKPPAPIHRWREHPARLTHADARYRREAFIRLKARAAADPRSGLDLDQGRTVWLAGASRNARWWCDALVAEGVCVNGFVDLDRIGARQRFRHRPVITYRELAATRAEALVIVALGQPPARAKTLRWFGEWGWRSGREYVIGV